jgi:uncharacterized membrane protein SpoIIM required for sporulation
VNLSLARSRMVSNGALRIATREIRDQFRDWRIITPILILTLFFPILMNFTAQQAVSFVERYGAPIVGERLIPFLLMVVGFFPISISLVIALESFDGERERLSLEPLLASPLTDTELYVGKILASLVPPLVAAYLGISVYLAGLLLRLGWTPPLQLLVQVVLLTTAQAMVMVTGAVVISSQTTSVRAANLLASFVIIPVSQLIIGESLIMFWGRYHILWWIVAALLLISYILARMGLHLFNREELLGREIDLLDVKWVWRTFQEAFTRGATGIASWYRSLITESLKKARGSLVLMSFALAAAYVIGFQVAGTYRIPSEAIQLERMAEGFGSALDSFGFFSGQGVLWVLSNNIRAIAIASFLGAFSFGVMAVILLMLPVGIIGYFAGNVALADQSAAEMVTAFVLPHALLEIPAAIVAGAAILQLGLAAVSLPKGSSLGESLLVAFADWLRLSLGLALPLFIGAAVIEVFLTPRIALMLLTGP